MEGHGLWNQPRGFTFSTSRVTMEKLLDLFCYSISPSLPHGAVLQMKCYASYKHGRGLILNPLPLGTDICVVDRLPEKSFLR